MKMKTALSVIGATLLLCGAAMAQSASEWTGQVKLGGVVSQSTGQVKPGPEFFEDPTKANPLSYRRLYETAGFIGGSYDSFGMIVEGEITGQKSFSAVDVVFINRTIADGLRPGDQYYVFHADDSEVSHPVTGKAMGSKVLVDGVIEVIEPGTKFSRAKIIRSYNSIRPGFRLRQYEDSKVPAIDMDKPIAEKGVEGIVLSSKDRKNSYGTGDVIYLDKGKKDFVEVGDLFEMIAQAKDAKESPERVLGRVRILAVEEETATAIIVASTQSSRVGDTVRYIPEREIKSPVVMKSGKK
jgi:hypothetical protein